MCWKMAGVGEQKTQPRGCRATKAMDGEVRQVVKAGPCLLNTTNEMKVSKFSQILPVKVIISPILNIRKKQHLSCAYNRRQISKANKVQRNLTKLKRLQLRALLL